MERRFKFTIKTLEGLPLPDAGKNIFFYDTEVKGLALLVTSKGAKTFYIYKKMAGKPIQLKIGRYDLGEWKIEAARAEARRLIGDLAAGKDLAGNKRRLRAESTLGELFQWYVTDCKGKNLKPKTLAHYQHTFRLYLDKLAKRKASEVTKADIRAVHLKVSKSAPYAANRMLALVSAVYNGAIKADVFAGSNPALGIPRNKETSRETRLLPSQVEGFFRALDAYPDENLRDFFALALLTGQRKGSVLSMKWADVHLEDRLWIIPDTKNNRPLPVPLEDEDIAILKTRKAARKDPENPWVFPSHGKSGHLVEPKKAWRTILKEAGIPTGELRIHDLRRSLGSFMVDAGVSLPTIGKTLGHLNQSTTAIYARLALDPVREAKQKAHAAIAAYRQGVGNKVIELNHKRLTGKES